MLVASIGNNQPLLWDNQPVHHGLYATRSTFVALDTSGKMIRNRIVHSLYNSYTRKGTNGQFYMSGQSGIAIQIDTIQIGNAGVSLPPSLKKGVYYTVVSNKKWTTTRTFVLL